jgi:hypothetical protein
VLSPQILIQRVILCVWSIIAPITLLNT